jgi:hypothetical protein
MAQEVQKTTDAYMAQVKLEITFCTYPIWFVSCTGSELDKGAS